MINPRYYFNSNRDHASHDYRGGATQSNRSVFVAAHATWMTSDAMHPLFQSEIETDCTLPPYRLP